MSSITIVDGTSTNRSFATYTDSSGNLTFGHTPLVAGLPVSNSNAFPVVIAAGNSTIGTVSVNSLPALPTGSNVIGSTNTSPLTLTATYVSVTSTSAIALTANSNRRSLEIYNVGTGNVTFGYGSAPVAGQGITLNSASVAGSRGDGYFRGVGDGVDQRAIYVICPTSVTTNLVIVEGI